MRMADPVMRSHEILSADTEELWEQNAKGRLLAQKIKTQPL